MMQIQYTKNLNPERFEVGSKFGILFILSETWFKTRQFSDADEDKPDSYSGGMDSCLMVMISVSLLCLKLSYD